jgi:hypothetical protein
MSEEFVLCAIWQKRNDFREQIDFETFVSSSFAKTYFYLLLVHEERRNESKRT